MQAVNLYQSSVRSLSDAELETLSAELAAEYQESYTLPCECCSDTEWTDEAAEARYSAMRAEIRRRWEVANPEAAARWRKDLQVFVPQMGRILLENLRASAVMARNMNREMDGEFASKAHKVGDTITVRRPQPPTLSQLLRQLP
jgi:hypothetical protein